MLVCEGSLCPIKLPDISGPGLGEAGRYNLTLREDYVKLPGQNYESMLAYLGQDSAVLGVITLLKVSFSCTMSVALSVKQTIIQSTTAFQAVHVVPNVLALHCRSVL